MIKEKVTYTSEKYVIKEDSLEILLNDMMLNEEGIDSRFKECSWETVEEFNYDINNRTYPKETEKPELKKVRLNVSVEIEEA